MDINILLGIENPKALRVKTTLKSGVYSRFTLNFIRHFITK
jgi:hypothetical protein